MILPKAFAPTFTKFLGRISPEADTTAVRLWRQTLPVCTVTTPSFFLWIVKPTTAASSTTMPAMIRIFFFNVISVVFDARLPCRRASQLKGKLYYIVCCWPLREPTYVDTGLLEYRFHKKTGIQHAKIRRISAQ